MAKNNFLQELLIVSEKAANIARICRQDEHLLKLLTQEKSEIEKNQRFVHDFKTLADVLIQEIVKSHLIKKFPFLNGNIHGEESNEFTNTNGESIAVQIHDSIDETKDTLIQILGGDMNAAECLTQAVYNEPAISSVCEEFHDVPEMCISDDEYGIWIDPIDSTAEYIHGKLMCALILIGVFNKSDGKPLLGVINKPFHNENKELGVWTGCVYWGLIDGNKKLHSTCLKQDVKRKTLKIAISSNENPQLRAYLEDSGYEVVPLPGAGFKLLSVILNDCDLYICSKASTFVWDTLACHAILKCSTLEGNIIECNLSRKELTYDRVEDKSNKEGLIAYRNVKDMEEVVAKIGHCLKPTQNT